MIAPMLFAAESALMRHWFGWLHSLNAMITVGLARPDCTRVFSEDKHGNIGTKSVAEFFTPRAPW